MKLTNKNGLPEAIYRAVANDNYSKGDADFSATELLKPPRITSLKERHADEIEEDASDRIWSLLGQAAHVICERGNVNDIAEKRFTAKFGNHTVSCGIDSFGVEHGILSDYKIQTVYKFMPNKDPDKDWIAQLNIQAAILKRNGIDVKALQIIGILRDWSKRKARTEENYPKQQVVTLAIPMWGSSSTELFIRDRIKAHVDARTILPECTPEEMWAQPDKWAVMKKGTKRSLKNCESKQEAMEIIEQDETKNLYLEDRPGVRNRCADYCEVSKFCSVYQASLKQVYKKAGNDE